MDELFVGRKPQIEELKAALHSNRPELVAVYGRRRVGKTYLVRQVYREQIVFEVAGLLGGNKKEQIQNFSFTLRNYFPDHVFAEKPKDWLTAFFELGKALDSFGPSEKYVLFFDELPWLASAKSGFLRAFGNFWNTYAERRNIVVVICGSAASWMIRRVIQNRGGLHNRITRLLSLSPFTLAETAAFCERRGLAFSTYQLLQIYMTLGGVPAYLEQLRSGESAVQNIQRICFSPTGFLRGEFSRLFASLFTNYEQHLAIVRQLANRRAGMTRKALMAAEGIKSGGSHTRLLGELHESGFIGIYSSFKNRRKEQLYRLTDPFTLFHLTFIARLPKGNAPDFNQLSELPGWAAWSGYAFENVWLVHPKAIKTALGITGVGSNIGTFVAQANDAAAGVQFDLLVDRKDNTINICEAKFSSDVLIISKALSNELARKKSAFRAHTNTKKQLLTVLLTVYGATKSAHAIDHVDVVLDAEALLPASPKV